MTEDPASPHRRFGPPSTEESNARAERARHWLDRHWASPWQCPICHSVEWAIQDVVELKVWAGGGVTIGGPSYVMFPVMCRVCAYTLLFNAVAAGVVPDQGGAFISAKGSVTVEATVTPPAESDQPAPENPQ